MSAAHCEALVRAADKDRFLAALFARAEHRPALYALYAFNVEIARVRELVREPLAGEIRRGKVYSLTPNGIDAARQFSAAAAEKDPATRLLRMLEKRPLSASYLKSKMPEAATALKTLEKKGLILRQPGQARSLQVLVPEDQIPPWNRRKPAPAEPARRSAATRPAAPAAPPATLYVLSVFLMGGPTSEKFDNKVINRVIEIRGDQTLEDLHQAIFEAFDREEEHLYEFQGSGA